MPGPPGIGGENKAQFLRSRNPPHELKEVFTGLVVCPSLGVNILQSWAGVKMALRGVRLGFGGSPRGLGGQIRWGGVVIGSPKGQIGSGGVNSPP